VFTGGQGFGRRDHGKSPSIHPVFPSSTCPTTAATVNWSSGLNLAIPQFFLYINSISPLHSPAFSRFLFLSPASLSRFPPAQSKRKRLEHRREILDDFPIFGELVDTYLVVWTVIWAGGHYLLFEYKGAGENQIV
jgi:hypothetical protein